jgi:hypothetical protein
MFCNPTEAKKAIEAGGAQSDIGDIEKDMNQVSLGKNHKILQNLQRRFDWQYIGQIQDGDFAKYFVAFSQNLNFKRKSLFSSVRVCLRLFKPAQAYSSLFQVF